MDEIKVKFTKDTKCCLGGTEFASFKKDEEATVSGKLGRLLIAGNQAEEVKKQTVRNRKKTSIKPSEVA